MMATLTRAPYGRHVEERTEIVPTSALVPYEGETYYGRPAIKSSPWSELIAVYFFVGGLAGSAQMLAVLADASGRRSIARAGRYLALSGALVSPALLIADLHTPKRWYNMLRIFRKTSPMSIGAWTLATFGTFSALSAAGQWWEDRTGSRGGRWLARTAGVPAGIAGMLMSVYTGTLLAATSTPLWASTPRLLPALFGSSAASTASAALTLSLQATDAREVDQEAIERFAAIAEGAELVAAGALHVAWSEARVDGPLWQEPDYRMIRYGAIGLGVVAPLAIHGVQALTGRRSRLASAVAAVSTLVGGFLLRHVILKAGQESARRPRDYFQFTQPTEEHTSERIPR